MKILGADFPGLGPDFPGLGSDLPGLGFWKLAKTDFVTFWNWDFRVPTKRLQGSQQRDFRDFMIATKILQGTQQRDFRDFMITTKILQRPSKETSGVKLFSVYFIIMEFLVGSLVSPLLSQSIIYLPRCRSLFRRPSCRANFNLGSSALKRWLLDWILLKTCPAI